MVCRRCRPERSRSGKHRNQEQPPRQPERKDRKTTTARWERCRIYGTVAWLRFSASGMIHDKTPWQIDGNEHGYSSCPGGQSDRRGQISQGERSAVGKAGKWRVQGNDAGSLYTDRVHLHPKPARWRLSTRRVHGRRRRRNTSCHSPGHSNGRRNHRANARCPPRPSSNASNAASRYSGIGHPRIAPLSMQTPRALAPSPQPGSR